MVRVCSIDGCGRKHKAHGWCVQHYKELHRLPECAQPDCEKTSWAKGLCRTHYNQQREAAMPRCTVDGCENNQVARRLCNMHWQRLKTSGELGSAEKVVQSNRGLVCPGPECGRPAAKRGHCESHYQQLRAGRELAPLRAVRNRLEGATLLERMAHFTPEPDADGCQTWQGTSTTGGYPAVYDDTIQKHLLAHRVSYQLANHVELSSDQPVHHTCANSMCVAPGHLQLVTTAENTAEMMARRAYQAEIAAQAEEIATLRRALSSRDAHIYHLEMALASANPNSTLLSHLSAVS